MRQEITLKELKCPKCEDVFNYGSELRRHEKTCVVAPPGHTIPQATPPTPPTPTPTPPVESATMQGTPDTLPGPADAETIKKLAIGEAVLRAVPNADPEKAAAHIAYATSRKGSLMKNETNKQDQTHREQTVTELNNMVKRLQDKIHKVSGWDPILVANLSNAVKFLGAGVATAEGLSDKPELKYLSLNASREPGVGDTVVVRKAFLDRYPSEYTEAYGTQGGSVIGVKGEGKGKFLVLAFNDHNVSVPLVHLKLKD